MHVMESFTSYEMTRNKCEIESVVIDASVAKACSWLENGAHDLSP